MMNDRKRHLIPFLRAFAIALLILSGIVGNAGAQEVPPVAGVPYVGKDALLPLRDASTANGAMPKMVMIQLYIFEVALEDGKDLGLVHRLQNEDGGTFGGELGRLRNPSNIDLGVFKDVAGGNTPGLSLVGVTLDDDNGRIVSELQALARDRNTTVYASPYILTLDGVPAAISTGDEVPYLERSVVGLEVVFTTSFKPVGVNLKVTPKVLDEAMVNLALNLDISSVSRTRSEQGFQQPIVQTSTFETHFDLISGTSVLLGAVLRRVVTKTETGVPYARDIPLLGRMFRGTLEETLRSELLIIVHPLIVDLKESRNIMPNREPDEAVGRLKNQATKLQEAEPTLDQIYDLLLEGPVAR